MALEYAKQISGLKNQHLWPESRRVHRMCLVGGRLGGASP
jgi:hypothetical protein